MTQLPTEATHLPSSSDCNGIGIRVFGNADAANRCVAEEIANQMIYAANEGRNCVLGLATGSTPIGVYRELVRMHRDEALTFDNVITFNLDEYLPMQPHEPQSYVRFMNEKLFDHIDIRRENIHIPDGAIDPSAIEAFCRGYENRISDAGGIDLQLLGIGRTGHVGFNEPGSTRDSLTRRVRLNAKTRADAADDFRGIEHVPIHAITMGVQTILSARKIRLLAFGDHKAPIIRRTIHGAITGDVPATFLQGHGDTQFLLDEMAASRLDFVSSDETHHS